MSRLHSNILLTILSSCAYTFPPPLKHCPLSVFFHTKAGFHSRCSSLNAGSFTNERSPAVLASCPGTSSMHRCCSAYDAWRTSFSHHVLRLSTSLPDTQSRWRPPSIYMASRLEYTTTASSQLASRWTSPRDTAAGSAVEACSAGPNCGGRGVPYSRERCLADTPRCAFILSPASFRWNCIQTWQRNLWPTVRHIWQHWTSTTWKLAHPFFVVLLQLSGPSVFDSTLCSLAWTFGSTTLVLDSLHCCHSLWGYSSHVRHRNSHFGTDSPIDIFRYEHDADASHVSATCPTLCWSLVCCSSCSAPTSPTTFRASFWPSPTCQQNLCALVPWLRPHIALSHSACQRPHAPLRPSHIHSPQWAPPFLPNKNLLQRQAWQAWVLQTRLLALVADRPSHMGTVPWHRTHSTACVGHHPPTHWYLPNRTSSPVFRPCQSCHPGCLQVQPRCINFATVSSQLSRCIASCWPYH